jgi:CRP-like cAMP-binding protein
MFSSWTITAISKLSYFFKDASYIHKQEVYAEGDAADYIYIVLSGEFRMFKYVKKGRHRVKADLIMVGPGEVFGEIEVSKE